MTQSPPWRTAASMASASRPVGVRLCDTSSTPGAIPAPVSASVTWAVAGLGVPAASLPSASVTVCLAVSVTAWAAAAPVPGAAGRPEVSARGSAAPVSGVPVPAGEPAMAEPAADGAAAAASAGPGWFSDGVLFTQLDRDRAKAAPVITASRRRVVRRSISGQSLCEAGQAGDEAPAVKICRCSRVCRMQSFCHGAWCGFTTWTGRARPGGATALPVKEPGEPVPEGR
jgi:hypothetical protein